MRFFSGTIAGKRLFTILVILIAMLLIVIVKVVFDNRIKKMEQAVESPVNRK